MDHYFNPFVAVEYGLDESVFLNNLAFWTKCNLANNRNIRYRFCWSYNTLEAFTILFPYWKKRQIEHLINKLQVKKCIIKSNLNSKKYDRTLWYALTPMMFQYFPELCREDFYQLLFNSDKNYPEAAPPLISQICEMDFTKFRNGFPKIVTPIPDNKPDNKPYAFVNDKKINNSKEKATRAENAPVGKYPQSPTPYASVENQSTSYNPNSKGSADRPNPLLEEYMKKNNQWEKLYGKENLRTKTHERDMEPIPLQTPEGKASSDK